MEGGQEADRSNEYPKSPPRSGDPPTPPCKYRRKQSTSAHVGPYPCPERRCPHPGRRTNASGKYELFQPLHGPQNATARHIACGGFLSSQNRPGRPVTRSFLGKTREGGSWSVISFTFN